MSGERPRRSGSNAPVRFGSGCGFRPEGEGEAVIRAQTGAWPFLEIGGFLQKKRKVSFGAGLHGSEWSNVSAWRLLNAQRWNPTHRPQFASSSRTGTNGAGSELGQPDSEYTMPKNKKPYVSLIHKALLSAALFSYVSRVEEGARTLDLRNHNPTL